MIDKINEDLKLSMKNQDKFTLSVLRLLKSEFVNESRKGTLHELSEDEVMKVIKHQVKVRKDSVDEYTKYGKIDMVQDLKKEIEILSKYLPEEMTEEEINKVIDAVFEEIKPTSIKDMGNIMRTISPKLGNADMSLVSKLIKDRLN